MDWDKLRIFHTVAEAGALTRAGDRLGLSQSAVSRQVSALEDNLGTALFHRHARGLSLTEAGEILFKATLEIRERIMGAEAHLTETRERPRGRFRVTTTVAFGTAWLLPRLKAFVAAYPEMDVELLLDDREVDLSGRYAEVAIRMHAPAQHDLIQRPLFKVTYGLYASGDYLERRGLPLTLEDLDHHDILLYSPPVARHMAPINWLATAGRSDRDPRAPALQVNGVLALARAVEAGMGIAALPTYLGTQSAKLVRVLEDQGAPVFGTYFVYAEELRHSKRVGVFRDFILREAKGWTY